MGETIGKPRALFHYLGRNRRAVPSGRRVRLARTHGAFPLEEEFACSPSPSPRTPSFIEARDGTSLFYRDWGTGKPLVFLSGWTLSTEMWTHQMVPLSERGLRCIAYDRRGHGRSSDPGRGYDYDTLADDLAAVLEALELRDVTLVGHSMASGELVRYLTRHGAERVSGLVFLAPAATPFLLKTADHPQGVDGAVFEHVRTQVLLKDFPRVDQ